MSHKIFFAVLSLHAIFSFMNSSSFALQSGGVEIGGLGTGLVVGEPFTVFPVHGTLTAKCVGGNKAWYSSISSLNMSSQTTGSPQIFIFKVTNLLPLAQGLRLTLDSPILGPTSMLGQFWVNPGQSIFISIPRSDLVSALTFVKGRKVIIVDSHTDSRMLEVKLPLAG